MLVASMERRQHRGESVPVDVPHQEFVASMATGAGELFQAVHDGEVVSSVLLLRAARGAYSQTMGTNPTGMKLGGARLVIVEAARMLKEEGVEILNLGGVSEENPGLREFKLGFGAQPLNLQAAEFCFSSSLKRSMLGAARALRAALETTRSTLGRNWAAR
jgi:lipid II:glycine glycyltransferase (peptidoglycan interpeptide bridge formation enzyme)